MATFRSDIHRKGVRIRGSHYGKLETASCTVRIPSGTTIAASDTIKLFILGANCVVHRITLMSDSDLDPTGTSASGTLGYLQRLKADAVTPQNEGVDASGTAINPSPATNADAYAAAATASTVGGSGVDTLAEFLALASGTARVFTIFQTDFGDVEARDPDGVGGPVDLALTAAGTYTALASDAYLTCVIEYSGKKVNPGTQPDYAYQDRYNSSGVSSV